MKPALSFYTNMPTPYQLDFFDALKEYFDLQVIYFTSKETDRQWELPSAGNGYTTHVLKNNKFARLVQKRFPSFHFSNQIKSVLQTDKADLVIVNGTYWSPNVILSLVSSKRRKAKVAFWGEPVFESRGLAFALKKILLWPIRHYTTFLFAIGSAAEISYKSYHYKKPIYQLPYNINIDVFKNIALKSDILNDLTAQHKSRNETIILSSGSLIPRKGMDTLIKAFLLLPPVVNARLIIIGDGPERESLEMLAQKNDRINLVGFQPKGMIPYWFNIADIFAFASRYDGWALVINEAFAAGNAIVSSTAVGAAKDYIRDSKNGFLVEAEDVDAFAEKILDLIEDKGLRHRLVEDGAEDAIKLSSDFNAKKVYEIYRHSQ